MKISKKLLREMIQEALEELEQQQQQDPQDLSARRKKVDVATTAGATMSPEEYAGMLKSVLMSPKVTTQVRKKALESLFGQRGTAINSMVLQMIKGGQQ